MEKRMKITQRRNEGRMKKRRKVGRKEDRMKITQRRKEERMKERRRKLRRK